MSVDVEKIIDAMRNKADSMEKILENRISGEMSLDETLEFLTSVNMLISMRATIIQYETVLGGIK